MSPREQEEPGEDHTDPAPAPEPEPKRPEPELADVPPPAPPMRRGTKAAFDEVAKVREEFSTYRTAQEKRDEEARQRWETERREWREEARASREAMERAVQTRPAPRDDNTDADFAKAINDLRKRRWAAASKNDTDGFEEAETAIRELERERDRRQILDDVRKEIASSRPAEVPEEIQRLEREFPEIQTVKGWRATVSAWDNALAARGEPDGEARYRKAFEQAAIALGKREPPKAARPTPEQRSRSLATGATGSNGGGGRPQIVMPPGWRDVAKRNKMSEEEYTRIWMDDHPELIGD